MTNSIVLGPKRCRLLVHLCVPFALLFLALSLQPLPAQELREFRNSEGKSLQGELLAVEGTSVTIKTSDGRTLKAAANVFSPEDQSYFQSWAAKNKPKPVYLFKAGFAPKRSSIERTEEGATKVTYEKWAYQVTVESLASTPIEKVEVRYRIFKTTAPVVGSQVNAGPRLGRAGKYSFLEGKHAIPLMTLRKSITFSTSDISVNKSDLKGGWYYTNGSEEKRTEDLEGIWIKIFHDGKEVFEMVSNPTKFKDLTW